MTDNNDPDDSQDEPTFDVELPDATVEEFALLGGGIAVLVQQHAQALQQAMRRGDEEATGELKDRIEQLGAMSERLIATNREAARYMLLEAELEGRLMAFADEEFLEESLGVKLTPDGEAVDADEYDERWSDIEVE